ncbi:MATE family efflux transporter [Vibrio maerlii]|uniref:MATE family efflux transporter n=1 Tax=Vibrio maerlii TaxID=2231648 RepID=UPI001F12B744|nr:MATE family efflux transporter [Vibrio maerlii]
MTTSTQTASSNLDQRMNIVTLTWPIFIEILLRTALSTSDVFMLSSYSDKAVSAVGVISQIVFFLIVVSMMVSSGTGILIGQYNGSGRLKDSAHVAVASTMLALLVGGLLSIGAFVSAEGIMILYGLEQQVAQYGYDYLIISGSLTINVTVGIVFATILRSNGYSKEPMLINLISGVINVIGNYIALYQPFGLPVYGVSGVAIATVLSQIIGTIMLWFVMKQKQIDLPFQEWRTIPSQLYKKIMKIGMMNAGEILSYNLMQMTVVYFVVQMGTASLAAFTYAQNIARLSFAFALALGQASQIQTSYFVGKGWVDEILHKVQKYFVVGFLASTTITLIVFLFRYEIVGVFTQDSDILALTAGLIAGSILLEAGRVFNLIFISALKGAGDIKFPVQLGIVSMWGFGVGFTYILGVSFGMGVLGAWLAIAMDEWFRGVIMARRWRKKGWTRFIEK